MVRVAIGQICSTASLSHNLSQCQRLAVKAAGAGAKALFLPEASDYIGSSPEQSLTLVQPVTTSPFVQGLVSSAKQHNLHINVGIHEPTVNSSKRLLRNTSIWITPAGQITHRYQKLHVFDVDLSDSGGPKLKESDICEPGSRIEEPYDLEGVAVGNLICFDLRFVEPALALRRMGARVLSYPSAFTVVTGQLHWEALLRARAVEMQCWVVAAAQCGRHNEKRVSYGDAIAIDPNGRVVGRLEKVDDAGSERNGGREPDLFVVDLDGESVDAVRRGIPLSRRTDIYPEV